MYELVNTSVPNGLVSGTHGYATVAMTKGMPDAIRSRVEGFCAYPHRTSAHDASYFAENPVNWFHLMTPSGEHLVGRTAPAEFDYTGRTNRVSRVLYFPAREMPSAGGAAVLLAESARFCEGWSGEPRYLASDAETAERLRRIVRPGGGAPHWTQMFGAEGETLARQFAALLAQNVRTGKGIFFKASKADVDGRRLLGLFSDLIALVPEELASQVTFSTFAACVPGGVSCHLRGVYDSDRAFETMAALQPWVDCESVRVRNPELLPAAETSASALDGVPPPSAAGDGTPALPRSRGNAIASRVTGRPVVVGRSMQRPSSAAAGASRICVKKSNDAAFYWILGSVAALVVLLAAGIVFYILEPWKTGRGEEEARLAAQAQASEELDNWFANCTNDIARLRARLDASETSKDAERLLEQAKQSRNNLRQLQNSPRAVQCGGIGDAALPLDDGNCGGIGDAALPENKCRGASPMRPQGVAQRPYLSDSDEEEGVVGYEERLRDAERQYGELIKDITKKVENLKKKEKAEEEKRRKKEEAEAEETRRKEEEAKKSRDAEAEVAKAIAQQNNEEEEKRKAAEMPFGKILVTEVFFASEKWSARLSDNDKAKLTNECSIVYYFPSGGRVERVTGCMEVKTKVNPMTKKETQTFSVAEPSGMKSARWFVAYVPPLGKAYWQWRDKSEEPVELFKGEDSIDLAKVVFDGCPDEALEVYQRFLRLKSRELAYVVSWEDENLIDSSLGQSQNTGRPAPSGGIGDAALPLGNGSCGGSGDAARPVYTGRGASPMRPQKVVRSPLLSIDDFKPSQSASNKIERLRNKIKYKEGVISQKQKGKTKMEADFEALKAHVGEYERLKKDLTETRQIKEKKEEKEEKKKGINEAMQELRNRQDVKDLLRTCDFKGENLKDLTVKRLQTKLAEKQKAYEEDIGKHETELKRLRAKLTSAEKELSAGWRETCRKRLYRVAVAGGERASDNENEVE